MPFALSFGQNLGRFVLIGAADEVVIGVRITAVNSHDAKLRLERVGFVIGATSYVPVRN